MFQITQHHERNVKRQGILKVSHVQARDFLHLLNPVNKRIAVHEELPGGFRNIEIILKKFLNRIEYLFINFFRNLISAKYLPYEDPAQIFRKLIDQSADSQ